MMDVRRIVHPRMLESLDLFFPHTCSIQESHPVRDTHGQPIDAWVNVEGLTDIQCRIAPSTSPSGREVRTTEQTFAITTHDIALRGHYGGITPKMRAVSGGQAYNILLVRDDGQGHMTWLTTQIVT